MTITRRVLPAAFFDKQVAYWGKVVKDNNIRA